MTYINEYGWSRDFHSRHFGSGEDVVLEKPVKIRNFKSLINELEALPVFESLVLMLSFIFISPF
jgi:hypothetical protein